MGIAAMFSWMTSFSFIITTAALQLKSFGRM